MELHDVGIVWQALPTSPTRLHVHGVCGRSTFRAFWHTRPIWNGSSSRLVANANGRLQSGATGRGAPTHVICEFIRRSAGTIRQTFVTGSRVAVGPALM